MLKRHPLVERLGSLGLLRTSPPEDTGAPKAWPREGEAPAVVLLELCNLGALDGGLSVALDVRADELVGPLSAAMGGAARGLRVLDVRESPALTLVLEVGGVEAELEIARLEQLPEDLNVLLSEAGDVRAVAILGEREGALQLWCVPREHLDALLDEALEGAWNVDQLEALLDGTLTAGAEGDDDLDDRGDDP